MVFFSPKVVSCQWNSPWNEDYETALLNQPLKDFQKKVCQQDGWATATSAALEEAVRSVLSAYRDDSKEQLEIDIDAVRLLATWSIEKDLPEDPPANHDGDVQQALACLSSHICPSDHLCRFAASLSTCSNPEALDACLEEWDAHRDAMLLSGALSAERLLAVKALDCALQQWQETEASARPDGVIAAQWRVIVALIRPPKELGIDEPEVRRSLRRLLKPSLLAMQQEWRSPQPQFSNTAGRDLCLKLEALKAGSLKKIIPDDIWSALETLQDAWTQGAVEPPLAFDSIKQFLHIRASRDKSTASSSADRREPRPITDFQRRVAWTVLTRQAKLRTEGADGLPIPLLSGPNRAQLYSGAGHHFREKGNEGTDRAVSAVLPHPQELLAECAVSAPSSDELAMEVFGARILEPGFRVLAGPEQLQAAIEAERRIILALTTDGLDRGRVEHLVVQRITGTDDEGSWQPLIIESIHVYSKLTDCHEALAPVVEQLRTIGGQRVQEWLNDSVIHGRRLTPEAIFAAVSTVLQQIEHYMNRNVDDPDMSWSQHEETWGSLLMEASRWSVSPWAQAQLAFASLKSLEGIEDKDEAFDGALEALGSREAGRMATILQRLYGQSLIERASWSPSAQKRLSALRQTLSAPEWHVRWNTLAETIGIRS